MSTTKLKLIPSILLNSPRTFTHRYSSNIQIKMADEKSQDKVVSASAEDTKQADTGDNKKTEDSAASGSTTEQPKPPRQLPTHYKGMPRQWEKNQVPKKDT